MNAQLRRRVVPPKLPPDEQRQAKPPEGSAYPPPSYLEISIAVTRTHTRSTIPCRTRRTAALHHTAQHGITATLQPHAHTTVYLLSTTRKAEHLQPPRSYQNLPPEHHQKSRAPTTPTLIPESSS
jgi:hypothetical protein